MFKWTYYAAQALHSAKYSEFDRDLLQALLQHYGWRSFYIDLTNDYRVGCWFAGHKFSMKTIVDITQDCWNEDIYLLHDGAEFTATETEGHLYVLSKECIRKSGKNIFDLSRVDKQLALRPHLQRGWLAGPIPFAHGTKTLDQTCLVAHIVAPGEIFRQLASQARFQSTATLFPDSKEDPFYDYLLSLPWLGVEPNNTNNLNAFLRELRIPEYHYRPQKPYPSTSAFFRTFWIADKRKSFRPNSPQPEPEDWLTNAMFYKTTETIFYANSTPTNAELNGLRLVLAQHPILVIETEHLLRNWLGGEESSYTKGVAVFAENSTLEVCELTLEHPGTKIGGFGVNRGYHYRWNGNRLERMVTDEDCPCGNESRHLQLFVVLETLDDFLHKGIQKSPLLTELFV
jgi:hypothetical protein